MVQIATRLDEAGVPYIQVTHGAGLGGNWLQRGFAPHSGMWMPERRVQRRQADQGFGATTAGLGAMASCDRLDCGARSVHVATRCTKPHFRQHIAYARRAGHG